MEALQEGSKVSPRESPAKGNRGFLVAILEGKQGSLQVGKAGEIAGSEYFGLNDREVYLDLVLTKKISPGQVQNLSPRAARLYRMRLG